MFCFENGGDRLVYLSSADWMSRNFFSRVETCFPVQDGKLKQRVFDECVRTYLEDNAQAWELRADGSYALRTARQNRRPAQERLLAKLC